MGCRHLRGAATVSSKTAFLYADAASTGSSKNGLALGSNSRERLTGPVLQSAVVAFFVSILLYNERQNHTDLLVCRFNSGLSIHRWAQGNELRAKPKKKPCGGLHYHWRHVATDGIS